MISAFSTIALTYILLLCLSPTLRKESKEAWSRFTTGARKLGGKAQVKMHRMRQKKEKKKQEQVTKAAKDAIDEDAIAALHVALQKDDLDAFQRVRRQYADDMAIQRIAERLLRADMERKTATAAAKADTGPSEQPSDAAAAAALGSAHAEAEAEEEPMELKTPAPAVDGGSPGVPSHQPDAPTSEPTTEQPTVGM